MAKGGGSWRVFRQDSWPTNSKQTAAFAQSDFRKDPLAGVKNMPPLPDRDCGFSCGCERRIGIPCISRSRVKNKVRSGRTSSRIPGPDEAVREPDAVRPISRSKARTVDGAAHARARIKLQGGVV